MGNWIDAVFCSQHVSFVMSYTFANVDPRALPNGRILRIIDMSRMDINDTTYEAFVFLKSMATCVSSAFPERVHRVVIVNPPAVFGLLWTVFSTPRPYCHRPAFLMLRVLSGVALRIEQKPYLALRLTRNSFFKTQEEGKEAYEDRMKQVAKDKKKSVKI